MIIDNMTSKGGWKIAGEANGKNPVALPKSSWSDCYVLCLFGTNPNVALSFLLTRIDFDNGTPNIFFGGLYTSANDFHSVQIQKNSNVDIASVSLTSWNYKGTDIAETCKIKVYYR